MKYIELLQRRGMGALIKRKNAFNNLKELDTHLRALGISELNRVRVIKDVFDTNLPVGYKDIIPSTGMCGYWAIVYKKLFDILGYESSMVEVLSNGRRFHHVYTRLEISHDVVVEISRRYLVVGNYDKTPYSEDWLRKIEVEFGNSTLDAFEDTDALYDSFTLYSAIYVNKDIMNVLYNYIDSITTGKEEDFKLVQLSTLCDELTFNCMTGYATLEERKALATKLYKEHKPIRD